MINDEYYMGLALMLAQKGRGFVSPNPMVGAVIVKNGKIIGQGFHEAYGELHAERNALANCSESPDGAAIYVTLEPCCHFGKTPPCTDAIIESGISRVVIGVLDPNPLVSGKGTEKLTEHGVEVITGVLEHECRTLNKVFFHYIKNKTPYVVLKYAMSADGKIATFTGDSRWISGACSRERVQETRAWLSGIMIGIGTALADDPMLTCRIENAKNPVRIICDSNLRLPLGSKIAKTAKEIPTIVATISKNEKQRKLLEYMGITVLATKEKNGRVDLNDLMHQLGKRNIDSILLEGGSGLNFSAVESGIVSCVQVYIAPKILGGEKAKSPVGGQGIAELQHAFRMKQARLETIGEDIFIEYDREEA